MRPRPQTRLANPYTPRKFRTTRPTSSVSGKATRLPSEVGADRLPNAGLKDRVLTTTLEEHDRRPWRAAQLQDKPADVVQKQADTRAYDARKHTHR